MALAQYYSLKITAAEQDLVLQDIPFFKRLDLQRYMFVQLPVAFEGARIWIDFPEMKRTKTLTNTNATRNYQDTFDIWLGPTFSDGIGINLNRVYEHDYNFPRIICNEPTGRERNVLGRVRILDDTGNPATALFQPAGAALYLCLKIYEDPELLWNSGWIAGSHGGDLAKHTLQNLRGAH